MKINVTKNDIMRGVREDQFSCAIARAAKRVLGGASVTVDWDGMAVQEVLDGDELTTANWFWRIPQQAMDFIRKFDDFEIPKTKLKPFSFIARRMVRGT